jgi:hypothetical protein
MKNIICLISVFLAITREAKYDLQKLNGYFCTADFDIVLVILIIKLYIQFIIPMNQSGNITFVYSNFNSIWINSQ